MELKKNPQADLSRNSGLYFVIGLTIVLFTTWRLLEHKTYATNEEFVNVLNVTDTMDEEVPITQTVRTTPPPPPPAAPDVIEVVEDMEEVEETIIESTESSQDKFVEDAIVSVDDVAVGDEEEDISVPFAVIEKVPVFPGCETLDTEAERKACFNQKIQEHIQKNFNYPATALEMGISGRVFLQFEIGADGKVSNIRKRGPDRLLEEEAVRIIASLPQMKPGMQRGRPAKVGYSIPINFMMQ
ncbi:MAG: energy transducer TonB [Bacteroidota bacterium]